MSAYIFRRLLFMIPTLLGIMLVSFAVVQFAPGGPVEQMVAELRGKGEVAGRLTNAGAGEASAPSSDSSYREKQHAYKIACARSMCR